VADASVVYTISNLCLDDLASSQYASKMNDALAELLGYTRAAPVLSTPIQKIKHDEMLPSSLTSGPSRNPLIPLPTQIIILRSPKTIFLYQGGKSSSHPSKQTAYENTISSP
jgi:hypothetical protein